MTQGETVMIGENDFRTASRLGSIVGFIVSAAVYGIVLFPMLKAVMD